MRKKIPTKKAAIKSQEMDYLRLSYNTVPTETISYCFITQSEEEEEKMIMQVTSCNF